MVAATYDSNTQSVIAGSVIALEDERDGNVYTVAKLADDNCWTIENLRLDLTNTNLVINSENTNNPAPGFMNEVAEKVQTGETKDGGNSFVHLNILRIWKSARIYYAGCVFTVQL